MSLLHPGLLYGLILTAIPVVLHFLMRARPRNYDFPALRLLEKIRKQNVQRMRIRHVGLLLLRMLVLALIVLAVTRPTLPAAQYGLSSGEWLRLAVVAGLAFGGYQLGRRFWVSQKSAASSQLLRTAWLRAGTIAGTLLLLLLLVGWPYQRRVLGQIKNPGDQRQLNLPVAAVLLFDVSPSMGYQYENQTRLEAAFELAVQQISGLPSSSRVAIADNAQTGPLNFLNDLAAATIRLQRAEAQQPKDVTVPLNDRILSAITLQNNHRDQILAESSGESDRYLREIYLFTDGTRGAWELENAERIKAELEQHPWLQCYVIDVGVAEPSNYTLRQLDLSRERVVQGGLIRLTADVDNQTDRNWDSVVDLYLEDQAGSGVKRDQQSISLPAGESGQVTFLLTADRLGTLQGELRIPDSDPLEVDNRLHFSVQVEPRPLIAIVHENPQEAFVWQQALAPAGLVERGGHQYEIELLSPQQLANRLQTEAAGGQRRPDVIYLMNVARLSTAGWQQLRSFVEGGGGLGVIYGHHRLDVENFRQADQQDWLPALPTVHSRANPLIDLEVIQKHHPVFAYLERLGAASLLSSAGVRRYWKTELPADVTVLARFQDEERTPAVVTRQVGAGRVVSLSTAVDLQGAAQENNWSELPRLGWVYAAWADQMTRYLRAGETGRINRIAGEPMLVALPNEWRDQQVLFQLPGLRQGRVVLPYRGPLLTLSTGPGETLERTADAQTRAERLGADRLGNYRVVGSGPWAGIYGFSLNLPPQETNLQPLSDADLDGVFGEGHWQRSRTFEELERTVLLGRIGQEAYPLLVTLLLTFFIGEHLVANLFYGRVER